LPRLLVGLGNPGPRYRGTRHNVGFAAVDRILETSGGRWSQATSSAVRAETELEGREIVLMKPLTYMNRSGVPVAEWARVNSVARTEILVYFDDIALPLGRIRLRERGTDGGHRGLSSVLGELGGTDVPRVRIGIRPEGEEAGPEELADFVLSPFTDEESRVVDDVLDRVVAATRVVLAEGMVKAMSRYNSSGVPSGDEPLRGVSLP
jgi:PTH1 family peptidyl-tRNA hydrolase